jgi:uncharacterized protein (TIGR01777 family)
MHILVTGGTGFIGSALMPALLDDGHRLTALTRQQLVGGNGLDYINSLQSIDGEVDAVINLAGASLVDKRWSDAYKAEIRASRVDGTRRLGVALRSLGQTPSVFLSGSAIGYYGPRGDGSITEDARAGEGFAATLCRDWEAAAEDAAGDARLCTMRLGIVFDRDGGAYPQMAAPFRLRFGNWIGSGQQWLSWVHRDDVVAAIRFLLHGDDISGAINVTAPVPVTSRGFCDAMQDVLPSLLRLPMPAPIIRLLVGEMADELLITGQRVVPQRLLDCGFSFRFGSLQSALRALESRD